jgi:glycosyltransferase involved in cell wall biosynthesis
MNGETLRFAYMGVVGKYKGIDLLLKSFSNVNSNNIALYIYGNCIGDDGTVDLVHEAERSDRRIRVMGRFDHEELPDILNNVDVMVVPSTTLESFGLVVTESLAYGIPVIASDIVGSAYEFIRHGENGLIFSITAQDGLEKIIREISADPSIVERMRSHISPPPRLEDEAFDVDKIYKKHMHA